MNVTVEKITGPDLMRRACSCTIDRDSKASLSAMYRAEHSPIRTQLFWVEMTIPTFVSVHFVRHKHGVEHFVKSNRDDRGGEEANRHTPVRHGMLINAQALINMARKRLCGQAHDETKKAMALIRAGVAAVDSELAQFMVPECVYRSGFCPEIKPCGRVAHVYRAYQKDEA